VNSPSQDAPPLCGGPFAEELRGSSAHFAKHARLAKNKAGVDLQQLRARSRIAGRDANIMGSIPISGPIRTSSAGSCLTKPAQTNPLKKRPTYRG
jgi:hypothetical protein